MTTTSYLSRVRFKYRRPSSMWMRPLGSFVGSAVAALGMFWMINGWFQGMGFPPCARAFTHWVTPKELATKMSIWNASTNIGAGLVAVMCGYLLSHFGNWRLCFFVPATLAFICSAYLWFTLPDTPQSVGLPPIEEYRNDYPAGNRVDTEVELGTRDGSNLAR